MRRFKTYRTLCWQTEIHSILTELGLVERQSQSRTTQRILTSGGCTKQTWTSKINGRKSFNWRRDACNCWVIDRISGQSQSARPRQETKDDRRMPNKTLQIHPRSTCSAQKSRLWLSAPFFIRISCRHVIATRAALSAAVETKNGRHFDSRRDPIWSSAILNVRKWSSCLDETSWHSAGHVTRRLAASCGDRRPDVSGCADASGTSHDPPTSTEWPRPSATPLH